MPDRYKSYHFCLGNSRTGPIGYCALIHARSPQEAVKVLSEQVREEAPLHFRDDYDDPRMDYIEAYVNPSAITEGDIDFVEELDEQDHNDLLEALTNIINRG